MSPTGPLSFPNLLLIMTALEFVTGSVQKRADAILLEVKFTDEQITLIGRVPGTDESDRINLIHIRNVKAALHSVYLKYLEEMKKVTRPTSVMREIIGCHLFVMRGKELGIRLGELYGHRSALETRFGSDYDRVTNDRDEGADRHLEMILMLYPYEFVVEMVSQKSLIELLLRTASGYEPSHHIRAVSDIFNWIKRFRAKSSEAQRSYFFTAQNPMCFALAEQFLTFFVRGKMMDFDWSNIRNFAVSERCVMIARHGVLACGVDEKVIKQLEEMGTEMNAKATVDEADYLQPLTDDDWTGETWEVQCDVRELRHIILELRKMPLQTSPSTMLYVLSNAVHWLKSALFHIKEQEVGADEMMPFFVYCLSVSKPLFLPSMITFVSKFVDDALKETSFLYYIEQLRSALEFIEMRLFPIQPYIVLPFAIAPKRLEGVLRAVSEEPIMLRGFEVWAFPTYSTMCETAFPAVLRYAGSDEVVKGYRFDVIGFDEPLFSDEGLETVPTFVGTFVQCSLKFVAAHEMIKVEGGDYVRSALEVADVSGMVKMLGGNVGNQSTGIIDKMYSMVQVTWKRRETDAGSGVRRVIASLQSGLIRDGILLEGGATGVLDSTTWEAIGKKIKSRNDKFILTPRIYDLIRPHKGAKAPL